MTISVSENFFIEPWQIEETSDALTLREEATVSDCVLGGGLALGLSLIVAALDVWLWRRGTIEGALAAWLGLVSALVSAKGIEQFSRAWRVTSRGPRCLTFRRDDFTVELNGFRGPTSGRIERIVIAVRALHCPDYPHEPRKQYSAQLFVKGQCLELGTFGAAALADRLAETIANCVGIRTSRIYEDREDVRKQSGTVDLAADGHEANALFRPNGGTMKLADRRSLIGVCGFVAMFCLYGFIAAGEPGPNHTAFREGYTQQGHSVAILIDGKPGPGWAIWNNGTANHHVDFQFEKPLMFEAGAKLTITLKHKSQCADGNLGCFRLSANIDSHPLLAK